MENIGYIIFLLLYLLLTSYLKRRRRAEAQRQLEQEEDQEGSKKGGFQPDFLKEILGEELFPLGEETEPEEYEGVEEVVEPAWEPEPETQPMRKKPPEPIISDRKPLTVDYEPAAEEKEIVSVQLEGLPIFEEKTAINPYRKMLRSVVSTRTDLKMAVLLKEILDKPRAWRRTIR